MIFRFDNWRRRKNKELLGYEGLLAAMARSLHCELKDKDKDDENIVNCVIVIAELVDLIKIERQKK